MRIVKTFRKMSGEITCCGNHHCVVPSTELDVEECRRPLGAAITGNTGLTNLANTLQIDYLKTRLQLGETQ